MKLREITQEIFESIVPAFATADAQVFDMIQGELEVQALETEKMLEGVKGDQLENIAFAAERYVCRKTAAIMIPQLDLTLTPEGFGIVRNEHITPASRERTEALLEQLRHDADQAFDEMRNTAAENAQWGDSCLGKRQINMIIWNPTECRHYGITHDEKTIYQQEYEMEKGHIAMAETDVQTLMGVELYEKLVRFWDLKNKYVYMKLREMCGKYIAAWLLGEKATATVRMMRWEMQKYLQNHINELPEYANSDVVRNYGRSYQNKKSDKTFFLG